MTSRPYAEDSATDDQLIDECLLAQILRLTDGTVAMAQRSFRLPSGAQPTSQQVETAFRRVERLRRLLDERQRARGLPADPDLFARMAADRVRRVMRDREFYLEAFVAETGLRPSECVLVVQQQGDHVTTTYRAAAAGKPEGQ